MISIKILSKFSVGRSMRRNDTNEAKKDMIVKKIQFWKINVPVMSNGLVLEK